MPHWSLTNVMSIHLAALFLILSSLTAGATTVLEANLSGIIHPVTAEIIASAIQQAYSDDDALVILRVDTPGGLAETMRKCVSEIEASHVPIAVYVGPRGARAASAGFFLLEAADIAAMSPGANAGAAHPVILGSQMDPVMKAKLENDAAAAMRSIATQRGRNVELAESAVRESQSFTEREALDGHLIDFVASDEADLLRQLDGRSIRRFDGSPAVLHVANASITMYRKTIRQRVLSAVSDPNIALILVAIGVLGILVEFTSPGLIFPGVAGALLALLGLTALSMLPLNWFGAALVLAGVAMFALELKFVSHGTLSAGGAIALIWGAIMLIDSPMPELRIHPLTAVAVTLPLAILAAMLVTLAMRARRNKIVTGAEGMIGACGVTLDDLSPDGRVLVHGENWQARAAENVVRGTRVRITGITNLLLRVEPISAYEEM